MTALRSCLACAGLLALTSGALAGGALAQTPTLAQIQNTQTQSAQAQNVLRPGPKPLSDDDLSGFSGGAAAALSAIKQQLTAMNSGNSVNAGSVVNGAVTLSSNAFAGFSGLGNFVINTGNNNNVQGVMSVNIVMVPAGTP
jgi:hypothetical protein